jgi:hypothetical protein
MKFNNPVTPCDAYTAYIDWEDYDVVVAAAPSNMSYSSSTTTQTNTTSVNAGTTQQEVVGVQLVTTGTVSALEATNFQFKTNGTSNTGDIENARLWSTGISSSFATTTQVGSVVASPSGNFSFSTSVFLDEGTNYFWLTYDVKAAAAGGNLIDAECSSIEVDGSFYTPTVQNPGSGRSIIAATNMTYLSSTTVQNSSPVPKNSAENHVVGVEIVTDGALNPFDITQFSLSENSTSTADIENAKIWYTGTDPTFATTNQFGSTTASPSGSYNITGSQTLANGTNYFWITYDVKSGATGGNYIDVNCNDMTIDGATKVPTLTAPLGSRLIVSGTPYFSTGSNDMTSLSSWNSERDGSGSTPSSFSSSYSFWVQSGHSMTTSTTQTIPYMYVEDGGYVTASYVISYTDMRILSGGIYEQSAYASTASYITNFYIENEGTWIHNQNGYLPGNSRYFSPNSHQWFYQWGGGTFPSGTSWGNVLFEGTTIGNFDLRYVMTDIQGDWEWRKIGSNNFLWDGATETIDVGGDLIFSGGWFQGAGDGAGFGAPKNNTLTLNVDGDFIMTDGEFNDYYSGNNNTKTIFNVKGNVEITGGTLTLDDAPGGASEVNLTVGTASVNWEQSSSATVELPNTTIPSGKTVTLIGDEMGDIQSGRTITVESGGALYTETYPVTGSGALDIESGSTLGMGSTYSGGALTSTAGQGNVQVTGTRTFDGGATYVYNGSADQVTGDQLPTTISGGLTMNNSGADATITLTQDVLVTGDLNLTLGDLISTSADRLTIGAGATIVPVRGGSNSFVSGILDRVVDATSDFEVPIGSSPDDRWRPMTITPHDATQRTWTVEFIDTDPNTALGSTFLSTDSIISMNAIYYYDLTNQAADGADVDVKIWYQDSDLGTIAESKLVIGHWDTGNSWWDAFNLDNLASDWNRSSSSNWVQTTGGVSGVGQIGPGGGGTVLPIELLSFDATCGTEGAELTWTTALEIQNSHFTIEHSTDGINFEMIGIVYGGGNSNQIKTYEFLHELPLGGVNYYRLLQTDFDGTITTAGTLATKCQAVFDIVSIHPVPTSDRLSVLFQMEDAGVVDIQLYDLVGRLLYSSAMKAQSGKNGLDMDLSKLAAGMYHLRMQTGDDLIQRKVVKD